MLDNKLIESALQLTGKDYSWIQNPYVIMDTDYDIEKFSYYLLDRNFLIKYYQNQKHWYTPSIETTDLMAGEFWYAIMEYQSGDEEPLIQLLTPICKTTNND